MVPLSLRGKYEFWYIETPGWTIEYSTDPLSVQHLQLMWRAKLQKDVWNFGQKQLIRYGSLGTATAYKDICLENIALSPFASDHFLFFKGGIFELKIKERGGGRSDGKGEKLPARFPPSFPSSPSLASRLSPVSRFKSSCSPLRLEKDRWGSRRENQLITPRL